MVMWGSLLTALLLSSIRSSLTPTGSVSVKVLTLSGRYIFSNSGIWKLLKYLLVIVPALSYTLRVMGIPLSLMRPGLVISIVIGSFAHIRMLSPGSPTVWARIVCRWDQGSTIPAIHLDDISYHNLFSGL